MQFWSNLNVEKKILQLFQKIFRNFAFFVSKNPLRKIEQRERNLWSGQTDPESVAKLFWRTEH